MSATPVLFVCMGVSGSGKTTLAKSIAKRYGLTFLDADDDHSPANRYKMASGIPLTDADRKPWMDAVCRRLRALARSGLHYTLAHSGLRRADRERLRKLGFRTVFLHLDASYAVIAERLASRKEHFMHPGLLHSQFAALQPPRDEPDVYHIDAGIPAAAMINSVRTIVEAHLPGDTPLPESATS